MTAQGPSAPAWLFSFVDLAFLLIIALTQVGADGSPGAPDLGEILVPRVTADVTDDLPADAVRRWQLRVHAPDPELPPFELVAADGSATDLRLDAAALRARLAELRAASIHRPLLAPHEDSRSRDLLDAAGAIEALWPGRRRATVEPVVATR